MYKLKSRDGKCLKPTPPLKKGANRNPNPNSLRIPICELLEPINLAKDNRKIGRLLKRSVKPDTQTFLHKVREEVYMKKVLGCVLLACLAFPLQATFAQDMGKLLATGGVSQVEGSGGGGLTPWALITGYGTRDSFGGNVYFTYLPTQDYALTSYGAALGLFDRFEVSVAQQSLKGKLAPLNALNLRQDIFGVKLKLFGDAVYEQDTWLPQVALGAQYKRDQRISGLGALGVSNVKQLGAAKDKGTDIYLSATKILLDQSLLVSGTVRATKANQGGLLGFGGDLHNGYKLRFEGSFAYLFNRKLAAGVEYRQKSNNLAIDKNEKDWGDVFIAYFPSRNLSITAAYVNLGPITVLNAKSQRGPYVSIQAGF